MKKTVSILLIFIMLATLMAACAPESKPVAEPTQAPETPTSVETTPESDAEIVDGKFVTTRKITVEIYDRGNDGGSIPEDNFYTDFIKEGMLRDHNVEVIFEPVPRWTEVEVINNLLAAGDAPDVCVTYNYPTVQTYANMGGVLDMAPYLDDYKEILPNLWGLLGERNLYWNKDPQTGEIWAIEALLFNNLRQNTFVREDWLKKLDISEPTSIDEFENMLIAFRDNAATLLGEDAEKMVPFTLDKDVGWRAEHILTSFVPNNITDKDTYIYGFDDRRLLFPNYKEGVRKLNEWYHMNLIYPDFALIESEVDQMKAGYVGAMIHNWDFPYREADAVTSTMQSMVGDDAMFIAVEPFKNDAGVYRKFLSPPIDRKIFFPSTNQEPVASVMYLDWISKLENRKFLQIGEEGVVHEVLEDGSIKTLAATGNKVVNSWINIDYTITINGMDLGETSLNTKSLALTYPDVPSSYIDRAYRACTNDSRIVLDANVGQIDAETGAGPALNEKRDKLLATSIVAEPAQFDAVFDAAMQDYLQSGGQAIIDERREKYEAMFE